MRLLFGSAVNPISIYKIIIHHGIRTAWFIARHCGVAFNLQALCGNSYRTEIIFVYLRDERLAPVLDFT